MLTHKIKLFCILIAVYTNLFYTIKYLVIF